MSYLETYLEQIRATGNEPLAESVKKTAEKAGNEKLKGFDFISNQIGLLLGNVQSGKTGQMFGIMCQAADMGFPVFLLLTTDNVVLQEQTLERVRHDLTEFCICGENDEKIFVENSLARPAVIVLKKNVRMLKLWDSILGSASFILGNPLFIVDDEADAASMNTKVNQRQVSSINKYLNSIKSRASSSLYLQVTGTPQALLLQAKATGWHPLFTYYFRPGKGYLGGDFFFPQDEPPACIRLLEESGKDDDALSEAVLHHLAASAQLLLAGKKVCTFMIHPSVRVAEHKRYEKAVHKILARFTYSCRDDAFRQTLRKMYDKVQPVKTASQSFEQVYSFIQDLLREDALKVLILNGKSDTESHDYAEGSCIIIGGNTLGRGVTFGGLSTVYYTRTSKKPQADTMWQHSRMFGYDRDPGLMRIYLQRRLYDLFADINTTNNAIIAQIEKGIDNVHIYYPEGLQPTRGNVINRKKTSILPGGRNYFPLDVDNDSIEDLDQLLAPFSEEKDQHTINLHLLKKILSHIQAEDFPLRSFIGFLNVFIAQKPSAQGVLIVRRDRDIKRGSHALLSPNDWNLGASIDDRVVLTMYKVTGQKGWNGRQVWVPNIKLPGDTAYYAIEEDEG